MMASVLEIQSCQFTLNLPLGAKVLVKKGDEVDLGEFLAEVEKEEKKFDLAKVLKVVPPKVGSCLKVLPETKIHQGQIVAQKKSFLGNSVFRSPVSGTLVSINDQGILTIKIGEGKKIKAPLSGKVKEVSSGIIILEYEAVVLTGAEGMGATNWGQIEVLGGREGEFVLEQIPEELTDKILILAGKIPTILSYKLEALGAVGLVGGSLKGEIKPQELAVLVAGDKDGLLSEEIWDNLKKHQSRRGLISGSEKTLKIPL